MSSFQNREKVLNRLAQMPRDVRQATSTAIRTGAAEISTAQRNAAPSRTGALRKSIKYVMGSYTPDNANVRGVGSSGAGDPDLTAHLVAGDKDAYYAAFVEFGTAPHENAGKFAGTQNPGTRPRPFFFPVYRAYRKRYKSRVTRAMKKAIKTGQAI